MRSVGTLSVNAQCSLDVWALRKHRSTGVLVCGRVESKEKVAVWSPDLRGSPKTTHHFNWFSLGCDP